MVNLPFTIHHSVIIRMKLGAMTQNRITMLFDYWRQHANGEELVARGEQQVACMRRSDSGMVPVPIPAGLRAALQGYVG